VIRIGSSIDSGRQVAQLVDSFEKTTGAFGNLYP